MGPRHEADQDGGFTLIELMVVVLVIAVLLAIAIPTFLGARERANDKAVESAVRNAFASVRVYYADRLEYTADPTEMEGVEPSLDWTNTALTGGNGSNTIYIETQDVPLARQTVIVVGRSKAGRCFYLRDVMSGSDTGTHYVAQVPSGAACTVPAAGDSAWTDNWFA